MNINKFSKRIDQVFEKKSPIRIVDHNKEETKVIIKKLLRIAKEDTTICLFSEKLKKEFWGDVEILQVIEEIILKNIPFCIITECEPEQSQTLTSLNGYSRATIKTLPRRMPPGLANFLLVNGESFRFEPAKEHNYDGFSYASNVKMGKIISDSFNRMVEMLNKKHWRFAL